MPMSTTVRKSIVISCPASTVRGDGGGILLTPSPRPQPRSRTIATRPKARSEPSVIAGDGLTAVAGDQCPQLFRIYLGGQEANRAVTECCARALRPDAQL